MRTAIIIVDHGSRRDESNLMLEEIASLFARRFKDKYDIVEPAHMEIAEPSIATAYETCASRGALRIIVCPFFLGPGKHWTTDIPALTAAAAAKFPQTRYHVTMTLGVDDLMLQLLDKRIQSCIDQNYGCDNCRGSLREGDKTSTPVAARPDRAAQRPA